MEAWFPEDETCSFIEQYLNLNRIVTSSAALCLFSFLFIFCFLFISFLFNEITSVGFPAEMLFDATLQR